MYCLLKKLIFKRHRYFITCFISLQKLWTCTPNSELTLKQSHSEVYQVLFSIQDVHGGYKLWRHCGLLQWAVTILSSHNHIHISIIGLKAHWLKHSAVVFAAILETHTVLSSMLSQLLGSLLKSTESMNFLLALTLLKLILYKCYSCSLSLS